MCILKNQMVPLVIKPHSSRFLPTLFWSHLSPVLEPLRWLNVSIQTSESCAAIACCRNRTPQTRCLKEAHTHLPVPLLEMKSESQGTMDKMLAELFFLRPQGQCFPISSERWDCFAVCSIVVSALEIFAIIIKARLLFASTHKHTQCNGVHPGTFVGSTVLDPFHLD